jgi:hypothetical protein
MRLSLAGLSLVLSSLLLIGEARAQYPCAAGEASGSYPGGGAVPSSPAAGSRAPVGQVMPYSYWVNAPSLSRIYVPYGPNDTFTFQGRAYGSPGDRWSWYNLSGGNNSYLSRYYYPVLR